MKYLRRFNENVDSEEDEILDIFQEYVDKYSLKKLKTAWSVGYDPRSESVYSVRRQEDGALETSYQSLGSGYILRIIMNKLVDDVEFGKDMYDFIVRLETAGYEPNHGSKYLDSHSHSGNWISLSFLEGSWYGTYEIHIKDPC